MKRKLFEIKLIDNYACFYIMNNELIQINDPIRPEPIENYTLFWDGDKFIRDNHHYSKLNVILTRVKKEDSNKFIKQQLNNLKDYLNLHNIYGNLFVVKKQLKDIDLIGVFYRPEIFGGILIEEF